MGLGKCADDTETICFQKTLSPPGGMMFTLKRVREDPDPAVSSNSCLTPNRRRLSKGKVDCSSDDEKNLFRALRNKPWISYHDYKTSSEDESDSEQMSTSARSSSLPLGIVRGCMSCEDCQKVIARWRPEAGCRPMLEDAPVFFPLEGEFRDTVKYIASISAEAEPYGICRIVPPHSWRPPCPLKDSEKRWTVKFPTRVQQLDKLQVRKAHVQKEERNRRRGRLSRRHGYTGQRLSVSGERYQDANSDLSDEEGKFGFEPGPPFTLEAFEKYAHQFKEEYFGLREQNEVSGDSVSKHEPSVECIEGEYWRIVEHATEQLEVLYGADIETGVFGSGFPKSNPGMEPSSYESSGWNLNNIARLPGSVLSFEEEDISGVLVPWLYVGMCFSSFCWHVEDHHLYSLNYMHFGSPKVWYGVPSNAASKLEDAMKKHLPDLFEEQPDLLHKLVTQLSPSVLKAAGVPVYRAVQKPGEFVVTFPRAYHAGFNCGFNCAEAVNIAPIDWLPHGQNAIELYKQQRRKSSVSHDKLLLGAAKKSLRISHHFPGMQVDADLAAWQESFGQREVVLKVLKNRVDLERIRRAKVEQFVHVRKMDRDFDVIKERECSACHYDLHLSAIGCECVREHYACLEHVHELCACDRTRKHALYRYEISELDALVGALEGNPDSVNGVEKLLRTFTGSETSKSFCKEMHNLKYSVPNVPSGFVGTPRAGTSSASSGYSTMFQSALGAVDSTGTKHRQNSAFMSIEPKWNVDVAAMKSFFLKGLENQLLSHEQLVKSSKKAETLFFQGRPAQEGLSVPSVPDHSSNSQQSSQPHPSSGHMSEEKRKVELIVLSDDEDGLGSHSISNSSCTAKFTHGMSEHSETTKGTKSMKVLSLPLQKQSTSMGFGSLSMDAFGQPDRSTTIVPEEDVELALNLQHSRPGCFPPNFYTSFGDYGAKDAGSNKDWLHLGHLQASTTDWGRSQFLMAEPPLSPAVYKGHKLGNFPDHIATSAGGKGLGNSLHGYLSLGQLQEVGHRVDLLNTGRLVLGISWYNKDAIFPAGFRSRVLFPSILDPCQTCFYVSEVLDYGHVGPFFKVSMEDYPSEVFMDPSIDRCWRMVQEKVNMTIHLQHGLGKVGLPCLRTPEDIRGIELFGFTSPHIIKAVESLDWRHQCLEYWAERLNATELLENQHQTWMANINGTCCRDGSSNLEEPFFMAPHPSTSQMTLGTAPLLSFNLMKARHDVWR